MNNIDMNNNNVEVDNSVNGIATAKKQIPTTIKLKLKKRVKKSNDIVNEMKSPLVKWDGKSTDYIDLHKVKYLLTLSNDTIAESMEEGKWKKCEIKKYVNNVKTILTKLFEGDNKCIVKKYTIRDGNRMYCEDTIQNLEKNVRNFIMADGIRDYDMKNAQPTILLNLYKELELDYTWLEMYINERDNILRESELTKNDVIKLFYQSNPVHKKSTKISEMIKEYTKNRIIIIKENEDKIKKKGGHDGSKMSNILCWYENHILTKVLDKIPDKKNISTLMFDGFNYLGKLDINWLNDISSKYRVEWVEKPMDTIYTLPDNFVSDLKTFKQQKEAFEKVCAYLTSTASFKHIDHNKKWITFKRDGLFMKYENWRTTDYEGKDIPFLERWFKDPDRKDYENLVFNPYCGDEDNKTHKCEFNIFKGFQSKLLDRPIEDNEVEWFKKFINTTYCNDEPQSTTDWLIKFIAHKVQYPDIKIPIIIVIKGYEGTGKDTLKVFLTKLFGGDYTNESCGMKDVFGTWNDHLVQILWLVMNEVAGSDGYLNMEKLKEKSTAEEFSVYEKFLSKTTARDLNQMLIFSNNECPVIISSTDRRYVLLMTNEDNYKLKEYWNNIYGKYLNDPEQMNIILTWLYNYDLTGINHLWFGSNDNRPITKHFKKLATKSIDLCVFVLYWKLGQFVKENGNEIMIIERPSFCNDVLKINEIFGYKNTPTRANINNMVVKVAPDKYLECKQIKISGTPTMSYRIPDPQKLIDRLDKFELEYVKDDFEWEILANYFNTMDMEFEEDD